MIRIVVCGAAGRMGREVIVAASGTKDIKVIAGIEVRGNRFVGKTVNEVKIYDDLVDVIRGANCVVEFSTPNATMENLRKNVKYKKPYVIGTTGFSEAQVKEIQKLAKSFPILVSPNMSLGVNHLYNLTRATAHALPHYDIEIVETHHRAKKDAPSGTAKVLSNIIKHAKAGTRFVYGRQGLVGEKKGNEVGICAVRGGDIVGEHRVLFFGNGEFLELRHFATSRQCFAQGTIHAITFVVNKRRGLYTMKDMLKG